MKKPHTLSEAIRQLDDVAPFNSNNIKDAIEKDYESVKRAIDNLKPYLDEFKDSATHEFKEAKHKTEAKVRENPWAALGIVGLFAFIIGLLIGGNRR